MNFCIGVCDDNDGDGDEDDEKNIMTTTTTKKPLNQTKKYFEDKGKNCNKIN